MTTTTAVMVGLAGLVLTWWGWRATRWWEARAHVDPDRDPAAWRITAAHRARLDTAVTAGSVADALEATRVGAIHWRAGLRRIVVHLDGLSADAEGDALRAEVFLALGEVESVRKLVDRIPADHWRGCVVRAGLYAVDGDPVRAESALVAALQLCPAPAREGVQERLASLRDRFPGKRSPHQDLWERRP